MKYSVSGCNRAQIFGVNFSLLGLLRRHMIRSNRTCVVESRPGFDKMLVDGLDGYGSRSNCGGHPLYRPVPYVADGEDAGHARLHWQGKASWRPATRGLSVLHKVLAG